FFYSLWLPLYLLLLLAEIGINYMFFRRMLHHSAEAGTQGKRAARRWLVASIVFTIGILAVFKYAAFLLGIAGPFAALLGGVAPSVPEILLPLGISFYSFQLIALHVDVYRGELAPPRNLTRYALFVCFFPQLIAGPILRGRELLPQIEEGGRPTADRNRRGIWLIGVGLLKKVVFGDFLLAPLVDAVYGNPGVTSAPMHLVATYAFAFQIYFDFSGYTDMARGIALLLGYELPLNFEEPYLSRNPTEFWRRWHMTLSRWLRDYLYIPLGGNRKGGVRTTINLFLTMLLGGLWHGAGWNFVIWGGLHGVLLSVHRPIRARRDPDTGIALGDWWRIFLCFHVVTFLWIFFRASNFADAITVIETILFGNWNVAMPAWGFALCALAAVLHFLERALRPRVMALRQRSTGIVGAIAEGLVFGAVLALVVAASGQGAEFIYFQF
ncbi:MAG: MBOAT family O-acyltransferase, partial [bacterium]